MAGNIVPDMQAPPSPEPASYATSEHFLDPWAADDPLPVQFSQHDPLQHNSLHLSQHQFPDPWDFQDDHSGFQDDLSGFQDDLSFLDSDQSKVGGDPEQPQQPQQAPLTLFPPNQHANTPQRRSVACQRCRQLKVRCDAVLGNSQCGRCIQAKQPCEIIEPKRKRAKKADKTQQKTAALEKRVAAIENLIDSLTQKLTNVKIELTDVKKELADVKAGAAADLNENRHSDFELNSSSQSTSFTHSPFLDHPAPMQYSSYASDPYGLYNHGTPHGFEDHNTLSRDPMAFNYENQPPKTD